MRANGRGRGRRARPVGTVVGGRVNLHDDDGLLAALGAALADNSVSSVRVFALRHGRYDREAELSDQERPLLPAGERQAAEAADDLMRRSVGWGSRPVVRCSPYRRAEQTATIIADAFGVALEQADWLYSEEDRDALMGALAAYPAGTVVILVGHQPMLEGLFELAGADGCLDHAAVNEFLLDLKSKELMLLR
jgi:phosphohistidine phosphatase